VVRHKDRLQDHHHTSVKRELLNSRNHLHQTACSQAVFSCASSNL